MLFRSVIKPIEDVAVIAARELFVLNGIDVFDINEQKICVAHQRLEGTKEGLLSGKGLQGCVDAGVDVALLSAVGPVPGPGLCPRRPCAVPSDWRSPAGSPVSVFPAA